MKKKYFMSIQKKIGEFILKSKYYSFQYAIYYAMCGLGSHIWFLRYLNYWGLKRKTIWMNKYFMDNYSHIINKYFNYEDTEELCNKYNIWVFWAQGEENMPELVKACYQNLCKLNGDDVKLLTMDNLGEYVELPQYIFEKLEKGLISYTHFSDILRLSLLSKYGGMWLDATCWVAKKIPDDVKKMSFWSCKTDNKNIPFWSNSMWTTWALATNKRNMLIFSFVRDMLLEHAKKEDYWIDYLLQDYLLFFASQNFAECRCNIENLCENNLKRRKLWLLMEKKYDKNKYVEITSNTWVFKLSYKTKLSTKTKSGEDTFYGQLVKGKL
jgi:hypothetical protein